MIDSRPMPISVKGDWKPAVAICHPRIGWGGSERKVFWGIEALKEDYRISLITAGRFDLDEMNAYHGTMLEKDDFNVSQVPLPFFLKRNAKAAAIRHALYQRYCSRQSTNYDAMISAYGPCDFGVPAIYYVSDFAWNDEIRESLHPVHPGLFYRKHIIRALYLSVAKQLHRPTGRATFAPGDKIISVSGWVADLLSKRFKVDSEVIHPPIPGHFPHLADTKKEAGFVCLGRIAPEKRIEEVIAILSAVRESRPEIHLHIIGRLGDDSYGRHIERLIYKNREWVVHEGRLIGKEKEDLLSAHRFGIHACRGDAYPGAVAEMVKAGSIVFSHKIGGQSEIIESPDLLFCSVSDAVVKICGVLQSKHLQQNLRSHLETKGATFSTESFMLRFKNAVDLFMLNPS